MNDLRVRLVGAAVMLVVGGWCHAQQCCDEDTATCARGKSMARLFEAGLDPTGGGAGGGMREAFTATDVLHNKLDFEVFPATTTITGSNTMTVKAMVSGLTQFTFMLHPNLNITAIQLNGTTNLGSSRVGTYGRRVTFPSAFNAGDIFTLQVWYTGVPSSQGFGSITFTNKDGQPLVCSLSQPYYAATWWPCKDGDVGQPGDQREKSTFEIAITAPAVLTSVSNGLLQGIDELPDVGAGPRRKFRYATNYQMATYLACFSSGLYNTWTKQYEYPLEGGGTGTMPVDFYLYPSHDTPAHRVRWEACLGMLGAFRAPFGEYPFVNEKYGLYTFAFGGGMEHQTMTGQSGFNERLTSHELAHQWWGDHVTCRTWHDIWLNEGFATYSEALWNELRPGSGNMAAYHAIMGVNKPVNTQGTVYKYNISSTGIIFDGDTVYNKGAWVLHMLRHYIGDAPFFEGLRQYRAAYEGSAATTDEFTAVMSSAAGRDLTAFMDAWVYEAGWPSYAYGTAPLTLGGKSYLKLRVRQSQSASMPTYPARLDVRAVTGSGNVVAAVTNDARVEHFVVPLGTAGAASGVFFDEDKWVLNSGFTQESFVPGPPAVLETLPMPGETSALGSPPASVAIVLSENVTPVVADFAVELVGGGPVPFVMSYDAPGQRVTLDFGAPLLPGTYLATVKSTLSAAGTGLALDGEVADPLSASALPSGDGLPGGDAVIEFTVARCPADYNGDGFVDGIDADQFVAAFEAGNIAADFNADGFVDGIDYDSFMGAFDAGC